MLPSSVGVAVHTFQETSPKTNLPPPRRILPLPNISGDLCNVDLCVPVWQTKSFSASLGLFRTGAMISKERRLTNNLQYMCYFFYFANMLFYKKKRFILLLIFFLRSHFRSGMDISKLTFTALSHLSPAAILTCWDLNSVHTLNNKKPRKKLGHHCIVVRKWFFFLPVILTLY